MRWEKLETLFSDENLGNHHSFFCFNFFQKVKPWQHLLFCAWLNLENKGRRWNGAICRTWEQKRL